MIVASHYYTFYSLLLGNNFLHLLIICTCKTINISHSKEVPSIQSYLEQLGHSL